MAISVPLDNQDIEWLKEYADTFSAQFLATEDRFEDWRPLVARFTNAVETVLTSGRGYFSAVDEAHNELCIASAILANAGGAIEHLDYEPPLLDSAKSIDFRAKTEDGLVFYVDVKTIKPMARNRWDQFERAQQEKWLPENVHVVLLKEWLGGEIWHSMFAARSRMLEYTLEFEAKIAEAKTAGQGTNFVMVFCGEGFHWHRSELEDFASFYFNGRHRADDPFYQAELAYIEEKAAPASCDHKVCLYEPAPGYDSPKVYLLARVAAEGWLLSDKVASIFHLRTFKLSPKLSRKAGL